VPINDACYRALSSLQPKESGRVFQSFHVRTSYENAVNAAKLDDVTFHTLRHTFASWAMQKGAALRELQELLGHSSLSMTMRYAQLSPEHLRTAVSRLDGLTVTTFPEEITSSRAQGRAQEVFALA
jgi:site-specific recombinase XerD